MSTRYYSTTAQPTTLSAACTDTATTIQVAATTGFPATEFILALDYGAAEQELVKVTNVAGTTLTVVRGFDSTTAQAHALGAAVRHVHSADDFRLSRTHEGASSGVHGVTGALVGTTDTQALTNKDLSAGNTFPDSLVTLTGTQVLTNKDLSDATNTFPASLATDAEVSTAVSNHAALTATHGVTGALVGTTDTQTLTNKTLASPTIDTLAGVTGVGQKQYATKGADQSVTSSTVFVNDSTLTLPVAANATYIVEYGLRFTCSAAGGTKAQFTIPAGATMAAANAALAAGPVSVITTASGQTQANAYGAVPPNRLVTGVTAGSITLQFAQETSDATATTCKAGSFLIVTRIA